LRPLVTRPRALFPSSLIVFGPESGAVSEKLVYEAAREAHMKNYAHLFVIGFAIQANARQLTDRCLEVVGVPATYVQATLDLMMGDLLKTCAAARYSVFAARRK
jgi:adenine-specific DNA-methyltransferase